MNDIIKILIESEVDFTKNKNHNGDMWVIDNIRDNVRIYFSLDGRFKYMSSY